MADNNAENKAQTGTNPAAEGHTYQNWCEQRWEWRKKRREAMQKYPLRGLFPGLLLIFLGGMVLANQQGWISGDSWWQWLLIGFGVIFLISGLLQSRVAEYHHGRRGRFIWGIALIALGLLFLLGFSQWWPVIIIGVGVSCLLRFCW
jgi:MFS family permease